VTLGFTLSPAAHQYALLNKKPVESHTPAEKALLEQKLLKFKKYQQRVMSIMDGTNKKTPLTGVSRLTWHQLRVAGTNYKSQ
jgi:hypothetical protein